MWDNLIGKKCLAVVVDRKKKLRNGDEVTQSVISEIVKLPKTTKHAGNYVVKAKTQIVGIPIELASQSFSVQGPTTLTVMVSALFVPIAWLPNVAFAAISLVPGLILRSASSRLLRKRGFRRAGVVGGILGLAGFLASYSYFTLL